MRGTSEAHLHGDDALDPLTTVSAQGTHHTVVSAYMVKFYSEGGQWQACDEPMHTIPCKDRMGLVSVVKTTISGLTDEQLAGARRCAAFLHEYLPERFPEPVDAVLANGYVLTDITLRMLVPRELARANGFGDDYIIDRGLFETELGSGVYEWRAITQADQVRLIGNAVCSEVAEAIVRNDLADLIDFYAKGAA